MRTEKQSFIDKLLGVFGFRRPKKSAAKPSSAARKRAPSGSAARSHKNELSSNRSGSGRSRREMSDGLILDDNFEIISAPSRSKSKKKKGRGFLKALLSIFLVSVITVCVVIGSFLIYVFKFVDGTVDQDLNNLKLKYTSVIYAQSGEDKQGNPKYIEMKRLHGSENRLWIDIKQMPDALSKAFVSAEDKRFYTHTGVDWKRTASAMANLVFHFWDTEQGGSTITQQLIKNITSDKETSISRKIREIMRAQYLESHYSKDVIIECYLNTIHLGPGIDGVEVASNYYFDKHASELNLTQAACLAALTKSPDGYNPYNYPEDNKTRRNWVLEEMRKNGYITAEQCEAAKSADLGLRDKPSSVLSRTETLDEGVNSYFVDTVIEDVIKELMKQKNYSYDYAESQLYSGGYKIYSTVDLKIQETLEKVFLDDDNFMKVTTKSDGRPQSAMTVMDYQGHIVGIVGGRGEKTQDRVLNRAFQSPRQTGSSIKPVTAYAPAVEYNKITWGSRMEDNYVTRLDGEKWPVNYSGYYSGNVSILYALQQSLNTIPVRLVQDMGLETVYKFATQNMGITTLYNNEEVNGQVLNDVNLSSLALGGSEVGVTTTELTAAYCPFGNLGIYYAPHTFTKVLDQYDNVVIDTTEESHRAMSEETANIMCEMLQTVTTRGTGTGAQMGSWPIMSKTGTTTGTKDRWFVGCTPYYAAAVWFGMDNNDSMGGLYSNPALRIWRAAMSKIMEGKELKDFPESDSVVYIRYCTSSGKVARSGCSDTSYGYFKKGYMPVCDYHSGDSVSPADKPAPVGPRQESSDSDDDDDDDDRSERTTKPTAKKPQATKPKPTKAPETEPKTQAPATEAPTETPEPDNPDDGE